MSTTLSRRDLLKNLSLAGLAIGVLPAAKATTPSSTKALPIGAGYYRKQVGDLELFVITDGTLDLDPSVLGAGRATPEEVNAALASTHQSTEAVATHIHCSIIKSGDKTILVDTGIAGSWGPKGGLLLTHLANAGFTPGDITDVVFTHAHPDHLFGALDGSGKLVFANAKHHITKAEVEQWEGLHAAIDTIPDENFAGMITAIHQYLSGIKPKLQFLSDGQLIAPGVSVMSLPGHTNGHVGLKLESQGQRHWFLADIAHNHELFFTHPDWGIVYDTDGDKAIATRKKIFAQVAAEGIEVSGSHFPFPAVGHIVESGTGYRWLPEVWRWS